MTSSCPFHNQPSLSQKANEKIRTFRGDITLQKNDVLTELDRYAILSVKIEAFYDKYSTNFTDRFNNCFEFWMSQENYIIAIRHHLSLLIENIEFPIDYDLLWVSINNGIGTMFMMLLWMFKDNPNIKKVECLRHVRKWMKEIPIKDFPKPSTSNIHHQYTNFVSNLLSKNTPRLQEDKLYCPAIYTKSGNKFVNIIIDAIYSQFPEK